MPHIDAASPHARPAGILKQQTQHQQLLQQTHHHHQYHQQSPQQHQQHPQRDEQQQQQHDALSMVSPHSYLGLVNVPVSPRSTPKSVTIAQYAETISPLILGRQKSVDDLTLSIARDIRMPVVASPRSHRLSGRLSNTASPALEPVTPQVAAVDGTDAAVDGFPFDAHAQPDTYELLIDQISAWISNERMKKSKRRETDEHAQPDTRTQAQPSGSLDGGTQHRRRGSNASDKSMDLDQLESIVKHNLSISRHRGPLSARRRPSIRKLRRKPSSTSDSEHHDGDMLVPSCDAVLDNSKTFASNGGAPESDESSGDELQHAPSYRDQDAWASFKFQIVRLAHTLRLKGWRRVPMEMSGEVTVQRLSGALTNAVYVVSPPTDLPQQDSSSAATQGLRKPPPPKLLLRIYGPQVEHLIDREAELAILRRLARKHIGPRMLGTFANGRFEEYFHAKPLDADELRNADTSRQIAKRMRELHDGVELLDQERSDGPFVWRNWDKWLRRVERIVSWMDQQILSLEPGTKPTGAKAWMRRGYVCGVPWNTFKEVVEKYRAWLESECGGPKQMRDQLVFAHNDTQYGNILRLVPTGESPLLLPANTHKQLIVIDFEYSNANSPGLEFANHFTEWCYNYHDKRKPYACNTARYPSPEAQDRFIRAYVRHRPQFNVNTPKLGPVASPSPSPANADANAPCELSRRPTTSISEFMLDARSPHISASGTPAGDAANQAAEDAEVERLARQTRIWRMANTAQWVAWGIVQAKVPGMPPFDEAKEDEPRKDVGEDAADGARELLADRADEYKALAHDAKTGTTATPPAPAPPPLAAREKEQGQQQEQEQEEFDYLGYAQHRAMFFWGDALQLGLVEPNDLPEDMRAKVKTVPF